jgi:integrase
MLTDPKCKNAKAISPQCKFDKLTDEQKAKQKASLKKKLETETKVKAKEEAQKKLNQLERGKYSNLPELTAFADANGLSLFVYPSGAKVWRYRYRLHGKPHTYTIGQYPEKTLAEARTALAKARSNVANGQHPKAVVEADLQATLAADQANKAHTFEAIADKWLEWHKPQVVEKTYEVAKGRLEKFVYPTLGKNPISTITRSDLIALLKPTKGAGKFETVKRLIILLTHVFNYAADQEPPISTTSPTRRLTKEFIRPKANKVKHMAAELNAKRLGDVLRLMHNYTATPQVTAAMKLTPYLFQRPGEIRHMLWKDIDLEAKEWRFTASKTDTPHIVPLATQAVAILAALQPFTGHRSYVFPSARNPTHPMSENTVNDVMRKLGIPKEQQSAHGFRATARSLIVEKLRLPVEWVEMQLAHKVKDALGNAYNRIQWLEDRHNMMQQWADHLDQLRLLA